MPRMIRGAHRSPDTRAISYGISAHPRDGELIFQRMPGHFIRRLQQVAVKLFFARVGAEMTPVQFAALAAAAQRPGIDQATLSALIGYDRATIGGVIERLETRGWLIRSAARDDRRVRLVRITATGKKALATALPAVTTVQGLLLQSLSAAEREHFERLCAKILAHHLG